MSGIVNEPSAFESRLVESRAWLVLLARLHLDPRFQDQAASDIAQEACVDAIKYRDKIDALSTSELENWLRRVLRNKVIDFYRKKRASVREADLNRIEADVYDSFLRLENLVADDLTSPSERVSKKEDWLRLARALDQIPMPNREVVMLRDLTGWSLKRIAEKQGCSVGVVAGRLRRGRDQLFQRIHGDHE